MKNLQRLGTGLLLALFLTIPSAVAADDDPPSLVIMNGDEQMTISLDGTELTVVSDGDGDTSIHMVDLAAMGDLIGDSLDGLDDVMVALQDMQFDLHMGNDNSFQLSWDEETWDLDMDEIMVQVGEALEEGLDAMDTDDWTTVRDRDRNAEDLREELRELKAELRELRRQLDEERDDD